MDSRLHGNDEGLLPGPCFVFVILILFIYLGCAVKPHNDTSRDDSVFLFNDTPRGAHPSARGEPKDFDKIKNANWRFLFIVLFYLIWFITQSVFPKLFLVFAVGVFCDDDDAGRSLLSFSHPHDAGFSFYYPWTVMDR